MPDLDWNKKIWNNDYQWQKDGDEWSIAWGSAEAQWLTSLFPRIHSFLPARNLLEIAPGHGRWTQFLMPQCEHYTGVDISENCRDFCINRFNQEKKASFYANDGMSLEIIKDNAPFDVVFSFDSLVHVSAEVLDSYIRQIIPMLSTNGVAFIHHSNLKMVRNLEIPISNTHIRDNSGSYMVVENMIEKYGGKVLIQELYNWEDSKMLDCLTLFCAKSSPFAQKPKQLLHHNISERDLGSIYDRYIF